MAIYLQEGEMPTGGYVYQFQGLTDKTAAEIKSLPEVTKMEEVINRKEKLQLAITINKPKLKLIQLSLYSLLINHGMQINMVRLKFLKG